MKRINLTGWKGFYLNRKKLTVTTASTVKIYSKDLALIKKYDSIKYTTAVIVDSMQLKMYVATATNLLYCIDLDTFETIWKHRIATEKCRENQFEILSMQLSIDEESMYILAMELGRMLVAKHDFTKNRTDILFSTERLRCSFDGELYYKNSQFVLSEDRYETSFTKNEDVNLSKEFFLEEQQLDGMLPVVLYKLRNERKQPITVLDICDGYYLIAENKYNLSIVDEELNRIFTVKKTMIDGEKIRFNPKSNVLVITVHCARPANLLLLKLENGAVTTTQYEQAYDCIFREDDVILLTDRGKSKLLRYGELFAME